MAVRLSALCARHPFPPRRFLLLIFVRGWVDPRAIVRLEGLSKLEKPPHWKSNRDLPACIIVPQPTTLPRAPKMNTCLSQFLIFTSVYFSTNFLASIQRFYFFFLVGLFMFLPYEKIHKLIERVCLAASLLTSTQEVVEHRAPWLMLFLFIYSSSRQIPE
jgi:hypothetical protein